MSPKQSNHLLGRADELVAEGAIHRDAYALLHALMHRLGREAFSDAVIASYTWITRVTRMRRGTVAAMLEQLVSADLITRHPRATLIAWGHGKQRIALASEYRFVLQIRWQSSARTVLGEGKKLSRKALESLATMRGLLRRRELLQRKAALAGAEKAAQDEGVDRQTAQEALRSIAEARRRKLFGSG